MAQGPVGIGNGASGGGWHSPAWGMGHLVAQGSSHTGNGDVVAQGLAGMGRCWQRKRRPEGSGTFWHLEWNPSGMGMWWHGDGWHRDPVTQGPSGAGTGWHRERLARGQVGTGTCCKGSWDLQGTSSQCQAPQPGARVPAGHPSLPIPAKDRLQGVGHILVPLAQRLGAQRHADVGVALAAGRGPSGWHRVGRGQETSAQHPWVALPARSCPGGAGRMP